jgi:hypothetical protein
MALTNIEVEEIFNPPGQRNDEAQTPLPEHEKQRRVEALAGVLGAVKRLTVDEQSQYDLDAVATKIGDGSRTRE